MPAYVVVTLCVTDAEKYRRYTAVTPSIVARHGGRFLTRGAPVEVLEGQGAPQRLVLVEFPDARAARAFYDDPEYQEISVYRREGSADALILLQAGASGDAAPDPGI